MGDLYISKGFETGGELKRLVIASGVIFLTFYLYFHIYCTRIPPFFYLTLALFAMIAEIVHDLAIKFSLRSVGAKSTYELSEMGVLITVISGVLQFPIIAVGGNRPLYNSANSLIEATAISLGSLFNLILGMFLIFIGLSLDIEWLAFAAAMPNLINATFSLFPTYPFEGRRVFRERRVLWGILFFSSFFFYIYVLLFFSDVCG